MFGNWAQSLPGPSGHIPRPFPCPGRIPPAPVAGHTTHRSPPPGTEASTRGTCPFSANIGRCWTSKRRARRTGSWKPRRTRTRAPAESLPAGIRTEYPRHRNGNRPWRTPARGRNRSPPGGRRHPAGGPVPGSGPVARWWSPCCRTRIRTRASSGSHTPVRGCSSLPASAGARPPAAGNSLRR